MSFDNFWQAYPKRDGANPKHPAQKKFDSIVRNGADANQIVFAAQQFRQQMLDKGKFGTEYVPMAQTWLNQRRFEEYPLEAAEKPADERNDFSGVILPRDIECPVWGRIRGRLRAEMGHATAKVWLSQISFTGLSAGIPSFVCSSTKVREWMLQKCHRMDELWLEEGFPTPSYYIHQDNVVELPQFVTSGGME